MRSSCLIYTIVYDIRNYIRSRQLKTLTPVVGVSPTRTKYATEIGDLVFFFTDDDRDIISYTDNGDSLDHVSFSRKNRAMVLAFLALFFASDSSRIYGERFMVYESFEIGGRVFNHLSEEAIEFILGCSKEFHDNLAKYLMPMNSPEEHKTNKLTVVLTKRKDLPQGCYYPARVTYFDATNICSSCPNLKHYQGPSSDKIAIPAHYPYADPALPCE